MLIMVFILSACGDKFQMLKPGERKDLYTKEFLFSIEKVKEAFAKGDGAQALFILERIEDQNLNPTEKALKYNLRGVLDFSQGGYENAIIFFKKGLETSVLDKSLTAQLNLNLASSFFKINDSVRAYTVIRLANEEFLTPDEKNKYYRLLFVLADKVGNPKEALEGLTNFMSSEKTIGDLRQSEYFGSLSRLFGKLGQNEKIRYLEKFQESQNLAAGFMGYTEIESLLYNGEKKYAEDLISWMRNNYSDQTEIMQLLENFQDRMKTISRIDSSKVGVVLPFSGSRKSFGNRALVGLDFSLRKWKEEFQNIDFLIKDSESNGAVGAFRVRQLIEKHSVSMIIGGLFSDEAKEEYLEARKYGVVYISLSPIYLPRKEKSHLLIEIPGSVQSEVEALLSPKILNNFGKKIAVIYPNSERGDTYLNEMWNFAKEKNIEIPVVHRYEKGLSDYRKDIAKVLDLKFKRQREDELEFLTEIYSIKGKSAVRRVQTLPPNLDFDWAFIPAYPKEAVQLVPSFAYYDAFKMNVFGTSSWRSSLTQRISGSSAKLYFLGDKSDFIPEERAQEFVRKYKKKPGIVEIMMMDGVYISSALAGNEVDNRDKFNSALKNNDIITGLTGTFELKNNLWIKDLAPLRVRAKGVTKVNLQENPPTEDI